MTTDEYLQRKRDGLPIESTRELVHALHDLRKRVPEATREWYRMNRWIRDAMDLADKDDQEAEAAEQSKART